MTRSEIETEYKIIDGTIVSPGKMEGEAVYAPHFYDAILNGCSDETLYDGDDATDWFEISDDDRAEFPELAGVECVYCFETSTGFFYCRTATLADLEKARAECAASDDSEGME